MWLLKRFLYKPILDAIDAREQRIAAELADADEKRAEAQQERETFQQKNQEFDQQRAARLAQAIDEAKTERQRLLDEARQAADALRAKRQVALRQESEQLNQALMNRTQQEVFAIARKTLTDLAGTGLEERLVDVFIKRLESLDEDRLAVLTKAQKTATDPARVRSAFDLSADQRAAIQSALNKTFATEIPVRFETSPDLISGIELSTNGQRIAWSIAEYLKSLEQEVGELLKAKDQSDIEPKAAQPAPDAAHP